MAAVAISLCSCGGNAPTKAIPGAGATHLYELMEEDSTQQKTDSVNKER
jgi:hypothetical protein